MLPGDRIGLSSDDVELAFETSSTREPASASSARISPPGQPRRTDGEPFQDYKLDVAATLQSDAAVTPSPPPPAAGGAGAGAGSTPAPGAPAPVLTRLTIAPRSFCRRVERTEHAERRQLAAGSEGELPARRRGEGPLHGAAHPPGAPRGLGATARCVAPTRRQPHGGRLHARSPLSPGASRGRPAPHGASASPVASAAAGSRPAPTRWLRRRPPARRTGKPVRRSFRITR